MDRKLKQRWLDALRSGRYRQTDSSLKTQFGRIAEPHYCCLGVLIEIEAPEEFVRDGSGLATLRWELPANADDPNVDDDLRSTSYLNRKLMERFDISEADMLAAAEMNDNGESFEQIADWIEENVK